MLDELINKTHRQIFCYNKNIGYQFIPNLKARIINENGGYYVQTNSVRNFAVSQMEGTTGRQRVPTRVFTKDLYILLPPLSEQKQIASILSNVDTQIQKEKLHKSNLERLKKGLMQKLLTGQIRVKVR